MSLRWNQHCSGRGLIGKAIQKYGKDNFTIEKVKECLSLEALNYNEMFFIALNQSISPKGYNIHPGGNNHKWTEELKNRFSEARKGSGNPMHGKRYSMKSETKDKLSRLRKGKRNSPLTEFPVSPVICIDTGVVYPSISSASKELNLLSSKISLVCSGKRKTTGGYRFAYKGDLNVV